MNARKHGLSIGIQRIDNRFFLSLKAIGKLTHEDYEIVMPMIDSALKGIKDDSQAGAIVEAIVDATELEGWELRAAWDDLKLGLKHGGDFSKVAIVGNRSWQAYTARLGNWFISGKIKFFNTEAEALDWL